MSLRQSLIVRRSSARSWPLRRHPQGPRRSRAHRLQLEVLEDRTLLSVYTVDRLTDTGAGSDLAGDLRYCITQARSGEDTISFAVTGTIKLTSVLPDLNTSVRIDGPGANLLTVDADQHGRIFTVVTSTIVSISGLTIANGFGRDFGGGIFNGGTLTVSNSTITRNDVANEVTFYGRGGGIFNSGTLTVSNCTLSGNSVYGQGDGYGGGIANGGTLTVNNCTLSGNHASAGGGGGGYGGGIFNDGLLSVNNTTLSGNSQGDFGDGVIFNGGTLTVSNSTLTGNSGSGILNAGIDELGDGTATVSNSTLTGNSCGIANSGTLTLSNSTITANAGTYAGSHQVLIGGIMNYAFNTGATVRVLNSTVSNNAGSQLYSGEGEAGPHTIEFRNTIISGNGQTPNFFADNGGTFISDGHNLSSDDGSGFLTGPGDLTNTEPLLGPLQDNGGPTQTMALLPGSPALNAGDPSQLGVPDQRGVVRSGSVNIGAYQASASAFVLTAPTTITAGAPFTVTVTTADPFGQTAVGYLGTVTFSSRDTDPGVLLPADYTLTAKDGGVHTFAGSFTLGNGG